MSSISRCQTLRQIALICPFAETPMRWTIWGPIASGASFAQDERKVLLFLGGEVVEPKHSHGFALN